jgi:hypothetical protein
MLEGEETKWRLGVEPEQAEKRAAELYKTNFRRNIKTV